MSSERTVVLGGGPGWAWATLVGLGLLVLLLLGIGVVAVGFSLSRMGEGRRQVSIAGLVALAGAGLLAHQGSRRLTRVARIVVEASGTWTLLSPVGRPLGEIPAAEERSFTLWADSGPADGAATSDTLQGLLVRATGGRYRLDDSGAFDLLLRLGYGAYWLDHPGVGPGEERQVRQAGARTVYVGDGRAKGLTLPRHTYDDVGISAVERFLAARAR